MTRRAGRKPAPAWSASDGGRVRGALLRWFDENKRDLPWRKTRDAYAVWVSEVMLQQTRVDTVIPYFERFLRDYPTVHALAEAPIDDVLAQWSGLGYYRRARMLHDGARQVVQRHQGDLPRSVDELRNLKGIGRYTAGAIASIAFDVCAPLVDGNVARVVSRLLAIEEPVDRGPGQARVWDVAESLVQGERPGDFNQALMELGATICTPGEPRCLLCPVRSECRGRALGIEAALPAPSRRTVVREEQRVALVLLAESEPPLVLMGRRRPEARFGGMWEPPSISIEQGASAAEGARRIFDVVHRGSRPRGRGPTAAEPSASGTVRHVLSHRRLEVAVWVARAAPSASVFQRRALTGRDATEPLAEYDTLLGIAPGELSAVGTTALARKVLSAADVRVPRSVWKESDAPDRVRSHGRSTRR